MPRLSFDTASGPSQWASMYRSHKLQVVPAHMPQPKPAQWKRPDIPEWKQFQEELVPFKLFDRWYGEGEQFSQRRNMGMITGRASNNVFVLDLDTYKGGAAQTWWEAQCFLNNGGQIPHCWRARTGGGGRHLFFRAPETWVVPNNNTALGIDIKGQGGFVVLPPSLHTDGVYIWDSGYAPYDIGELEEAPRWLLDAIDDFAEMHGGHIPETRGVEGERIEVTPSPANDINAWGKQIDGREDRCYKVACHEFLELFREHSQPTGVQIEERRQLALARYYETVATRLPNVDNITGLNIEGRGEALFNAKWNRLLRQRGTPKIEAMVASPNPKDVPPIPFEVRLEAAVTQAEGGVERLNVRQIKAMADPRWLIEGLMPEEALGFIFGPPGCGKSFIALSQALSLAMALKDWWGKPIHRPGAVIYVSSEGHTDLKFRIMAWEARHGVLADDAPFYLIRVPLNFMRVEDVAKLLATIKATEDEVGSVTAVYVDTVSRTLPGADENLQKDMTLFIAACDEVRTRFHATVIGVHHTSRGGNLRGSTVFDGAGDFLLQIEREEGTKTGTMTARKIKAAEDGWEEAFSLAKHELALGRSSLVAVKASPLPEPAEGWPEKDKCREILSAIRKAWNEGRPWSPNKQAKRQGKYAPRQIEIGFSVAINTAEQMVTAWLENEIIAYELQDKKSHRHGLKVIGWID